MGCGLGKTSIALTAINDMLADGIIHKVLVVCPLRVRLVWREEIAKWDHLNLSCSVVYGNQTERFAALEENADIYIINRENLPWLVENTKFDYDMCVLDELSSFKNWKSKRFRAFMQVRPKLKRVIGLTGTPSSNGLMDLFAEYRCLDMGKRLGRFIDQYRAEFFRPDKRNGPIIYSYKLLPGAEERIYSRIADISISMKSTDHLKMPELITSEHNVEMSAAERKLYDDMRRELIIQLPDGEVTAANAASLCNKLSQMANGAVYADDGTITEIHSKKLDALEDIIEAANGNPTLVAYWYRHDLQRIVSRLKAINIKYGLIDNEQSIAAWNNGERPVMLIHPASAGRGLNLQQGGSTIVWFSLPWSLELYQQTVARLFRQGQRSGTVSVIHIIAKNTIDEKVLSALQTKEGTQNALLEAVKASLNPKISKTEQF